MTLCRNLNKSSKMAHVWIRTAVELCCTTGDLNKNLCKFRKFWARLFELETFFKNISFVFKKSYGQEFNCSNQISKSVLTSILPGNWNFVLPRILKLHHECDFSTCFILKVVFKIKCDSEIPTVVRHDWRRRYKLSLQFRIWDNYNSYSPLIIA